MCSRCPRTGSSLRFKLLGAVGVIATDGRLATPAGARLRTLLALLVIKAQQIVSKSQFVDELWGDTVPTGVENALHALVARLRRHFRDHFDPDDARTLLLTRPGGYLLNVSPHETDVGVFTQALAQARTLLSSDPAHAHQHLTQALSLWGGPALPGIHGGPLCHSAGLEYEEQRLTAIELKLEADIAIGNATQAISELRRLTHLHPWRERLTEMLMLCLYRVGRQAEAVHAYGQTRTRLVQELGIEPSPLLQQRIRAILDQDPTLDGVTRQFTTPSPRIAQRMISPGPARPVDRQRSGSKAA